MKRFYCTLLLLCSAVSSLAQQQITLNCKVSGSEELTATNHANKTTKVSGTVTFVIKNSHDNWTFQKDTENPVRTQFGLEAVKDKPEELYYAAEVKVEDFSISMWKTRRIPEWKDASGEVEPMYKFVDNVKINRLSGQVSLTSSVVVTYPNNVISTNSRDLNGLCVSASNMF
jgi:hypothetical protein